MFFEEFSEYNCDVADTGALFLLESMMRTLICVAPADYVEISKADLKEQLEGFLSAAGFPPKELAHVDISSLTRQFIDREYRNILALADHILCRFPDDWRAACRHLSRTGPSIPCSHSGDFNGPGPWRAIAAWAEQVELRMKEEFEKKGGQ